MRKIHLTYINKIVVFLYFFNTLVYEFLIKYKIKTQYFISTFLTFLCIKIRLFFQSL